MTFDDVKKIVVDTLSCDEDKVTPEASLTDDLEADSLDLVELHMAFEDATGVKIPDDTLANMKTIGDICDYLAKISK
ncbi:MAG: acyl carrier protein [Bilifractor sp.]|jgi:acyl carrier protein